MKTPLFILSKSIVIQQYKKAQSIADVVSYSAKTNQKVTKILEKNTTCLFSVHFANELKHIKNKSRVIFLAQGWSVNDIAHLRKQNVTRFVVDNETDLGTLKQFLKKDASNKKISLWLRVKLKEHSLKTEKFFVFGMSAEVIKKGIEELAGHPKIEEVGIHFHRKTQNM